MTLTTCERSIVNAQVGQALIHEGECDGYTFDRDGSAYNALLLGVSETLRYTAQLPTNLVVDIGCGTSEGIFNLSEAYRELKLRFRATTLRHYEVHDKYLGTSNIDVDIVEELESYGDGSVGCFLAVFSLAHSRIPVRAIQSIRAKLCNGGVLKAVFQNQYVKGKFGEQPMTEFYNACLDYNFDIAAMYPEEYGPETMLAIKRPSLGGITAKQLIRSDFESMMDIISGSRKK